MNPITSKLFDKWFSFFLLLLFLFLFLWCFVLPRGAAPDEEAHFQVAEYIFTHQKLPIGTEEEVRISGWGFSYAFQPYLTYILAAANMRLVFLLGGGLLGKMVAARFINVFFGICMAIFVRLIGQELFDKELLRWLFLLSVMLLPQNLFMHIYLNTDSMALLSSAMIVYSWIRGERTEWDLWSCIWLMLGICLCALSYYNAYGYILCSLLLVIREILKRDDKKKLLKKAGLICIGILILAGWYFIRNAMLYQGDIFGLRMRNLYAEMYANYEHKPSSGHTWKGIGRTVFYMLFHTDYIKLLLKSSVGYFGRMDQPLPKYIYCFWFAFFLMGFILLIFQIQKKKHFDFRDFLFILCILIPVILTTYRAYSVDYQPQGRYILPGLIPFAFFICKGWERMKENKKLIQIVLTLLFLSSILTYKQMIIDKYFARLPWLIS